MRQSEWFKQIHNMEKAIENLRSLTRSKRVRAQLNMDMNGAEFDKRYAKYVAEQKEGGV